MQNVSVPPISVGADCYEGWLTSFPSPAALHYLLTNAVCELPDRVLRILQCQLPPVMSCVNRPRRKVGRNTMKTVALNARGVLRCVKRPSLHSDSHFTQLVSVPSVSAMVSLVVNPAGCAFRVCVCVCVCTRCVCVCACVCVCVLFLSVSPRTRLRHPTHPSAPARADSMLFAREGA